MGILAILTAVTAVLAVLLLALATLWWNRRKKPGFSASQSSSQQQSRLRGELSGCKSHQFTYEDLLKITDNFSRVIGIGAFGKVYYGKLADGYQVAVKFRSQLNSLKTNEFHTEIQLLTNVWHRNLVSLIGYCEEERCMAVVYEFMSQGSLADHLKGDSPRKVLSWQERLHILLQAARGLEYLHERKPPVVHRDVKTSNILLGNNLETKVSDLGLSRAFKDEGSTHVSTVVAGTPGYLDPEYYSTSLLKEKSDVYSFGIVILEVITGLPAIVLNREKIHIVDFVNPSLEEGNIDRIADSRLQGEYVPKSMRKAADLAKRCVMPLSAMRPTMSNVVVALKQCMAMEVARENRKDEHSKIIDITSDDEAAQVPFATISALTLHTFSSDIPSTELSAIKTGPEAR